MEDTQGLEGIERTEAPKKIEKVTNIGRLLGYGIPIAIFIDKFNALSPKEKDVLERIAGWDFRENSSEPPLGGVVT